MCSASNSSNTFHTFRDFSEHVPISILGNGGVLPESAPNSSQLVGEEVTVLPLAPVQLIHRCLAGPWLFLEDWTGVQC